MSGFISLILLGLLAMVVLHVAGLALMIFIGASVYVWKRITAQD